MREDEARDRVIAEALSWQKTPYRHQGRVKGAGVDCLMLIVAAYEGAGLVSNVDVPYYHRQFNLHHAEESYLAGIQKFAHEVSAPKPADIVLFQVGLVYAHAAIVIDWPTIIHSSQTQGVAIDNVEQNMGLTHIDKKGKCQLPRPRKFFSYW